MSTISSERTSSPARPVSNGVLPVLVPCEVEVDAHRVPAGGGLGRAVLRVLALLGFGAGLAGTVLAAARDGDGDVVPRDVVEAVTPLTASANTPSSWLRSAAASVAVTPSRRSRSALVRVRSVAGTSAPASRFVPISGAEIGRAAARVAGRGPVAGVLEGVGEAVEALRDVLDLHRLRPGLLGAGATGGAGRVGPVVHGRPVGEAEGHHGGLLRAARARPGRDQRAARDRGVVVGHDLHAQGGTVGRRGGGPRLTHAGLEHPRPQGLRGDRGAGGGPGGVGDAGLARGADDVDRQLGLRGHAHLHGGLALHLAEVADLDAERGLELLAGGCRGGQGDVERVGAQGVGEARRGGTPGADQGADRRPRAPARWTPTAGCPPRTARPRRRRGPSWRGRRGGPRARRRAGRG